MTSSANGLRRLPSYFTKAIASLAAPTPRNAKRKGNPARAQLNVECLESRDLLSASPLVGAVAPVAPTFTTTAVSSSQINLAWKGVSGAATYTIDEWVNNAWKQVGSVGSTTTSFSATGLAANTLYYFDVAASNTAGMNWANYESATTSAVKVVAPAAPTFTTTAVSSSQINLAWTGVSGATGYTIDEWTGSAWKQVGASTTTSFAATGLAASTTYYFEVGASNSAGTTFANWESATTSAVKVVAPTAPTFTTTVVSSSQLNLAWNTVSGATSYTINEMVNGAWKQIGTSATTSFSVTGLTASTAYSFEVGAANSAGTTFAAAKSATTLSAAVTTTVTEPTAAYAYSNVTGTLFGASGPTYSDVQQGQMGDCWLLSSLAAVAARNPSLIESMFTYKGTTTENGATVGLYSVRFYNASGVAEYVTVSTELPDGGQYYDMPENGVLWVALAEKAYVEANAAGYVTTGTPKSDSYNALNSGDPDWALKAITGQTNSWAGINPTNLAAAWNAGDYIVIATGATTKTSEIVTDHAYAVVGYNAASSSPFEVYNPWGVTQAAEDNVYGLFNASAALLSQNYEDQYIGADFTNHGGTQLGFDFAGANAAVLGENVFQGHEGSLFPTDAAFVSGHKTGATLGGATGLADQGHGSHDANHDGYDASSDFGSSGDSQGLDDMIFALSQHQKGLGAWKVRN